MPSGPHKQRHPTSGQLGIPKWQRDFWLTLLEHVLHGGKGPPDLDRLEGFGAPAITRYGVTTPDLLRSFRTYNRGKPYCKQVRPFGFMLMFQEEKGTDADSAPARARRSSRATMLRVISAFDRNPSKAARTAFDRDTGKKVPPKRLKTYARVLRNYYAHPEAKFLNGDRAERGPTQRRQVATRSIRHIGKEANRLDQQIATGTDPSAQAVFDTDSEFSTRHMAEIRIALETFGPVKVARTACVSRQHIHRIVTGSRSSATFLGRIDRAIAELQLSLRGEGETSSSALAILTQVVNQIGVRQSAELLTVDAGYLSRVLSGHRHLTEAMKRKILR